MLFKTQVILSAMVALSTSGAIAAQPKALVYKGPQACDGCPEAVKLLLEKSKYKFQVSFAGPNQTVKINADTLSGVEVFAMPGGPSVDDAMKEAKPYIKAMQDFVSNGGRYLGFCLGAYMAGSTPGFDFLPSGVDTDSEAEQDNAQVDNADDTIIQVDWRFSTGPNAGQTQKKRWVYFQEGVVITGIDASDKSVLATYSSNGDVAAMLTPYGKGWVGLTGPHPEATQDWYDAYELENPDGIKFDIGNDLVEATMEGAQSVLEVKRSDASRSVRHFWSR